MTGLGHGHGGSVSTVEVVGRGVASGVEEMPGVGEKNLQGVVRPDVATT